MKTRTDKNVSHQRGSTNVYADLGYKSPDEMLVKAQLVTNGLTDQEIDAELEAWRTERKSNPSKTP
jgi:hypothetical protein